MAAEFDYITLGEMRKAVSEAVARGITVAVMMDNAGRGVAKQIADNFGPIEGKKVVVLAGRGNNGGDGMAAAEYLFEMGAKVTAILLTLPVLIKTPEAKARWELFRGAKVAVDSQKSLYMHNNEIKGADIVVGAILGTGIKGDIREPDATAIRLMNHSKGIRVAVDVPSGLDAETGKAKDPTVIADLTVTLYKKKVGMIGNDYFTGRVVVAPIGIE